MRYIALLFFLWYFLPSQAQVSYYNFSSNSGLPSNEVYFVHQDREGYMWFGTDHGVVKYNGYNFRTYTTADGLTDNTVLDIKEDDEGRLWFLTLTGGICYYDSLKFFPHPNNKIISALCNKRLPSDWLVQPHATVWLGLIQEGFYKVTRTSLTSYVHDSTKVVDNDGTNIYVLTFRNGKSVFTSFWAGEIESIYDTGILSMQRYVLPYSILKYRNMNFPLQRVNDSSILIGNVPNLIYVRCNSKAQSISWPLGAHILRFDKYRKDQFGIGVKNFGYYIFDINEGLSLVDSLKINNSITDACVDRQNNLWLTSLDKGIFFIANRSVRQYSLNGKAFDEAAPFLAATEGSLYVGMVSGKVIKIGKNFNATIIDRTGQTSAIADLIVQNGKVVTNYDLSKRHTKFAAKGAFIRKIALLDDGILIGSDDGLKIIKNETVVYESASKGFAAKITDLCKIGKDIFAIGTLAGLYYLDIKNLSISAEKALKDVRVRGSVRLSDSVFAVSTRGRGAFISRNGKLYNINESQGLISNLAESVYFENDSVLWVGTFAGLSRVAFHFVDDNFFIDIRNFTKEDGLCSNQINSVAGFNGFIWLGTNEGLCYFKPAELLVPRCNIPLYIGNIYVNGLARSIDSLNLRYDENNLLIEFNALYYKAISGITYKVRLNGLDWKFTNQNFIQYFNLPAGDYTLEVAAEDKYGKYVSPVKKVQFTIHSHFTNTIWFKILIVLLITLVVVLFVYLLFSYQKIRSKNVIDLLKSEFKALNYQINPHFIFNVLNSIQYYILRKDSAKAIHFLNSFSTLIRRIVTNSKQQYISVIEEVECLKEYMDLEKLRLDNKFDYEINIDSNIDIEKKILLPMIIQPLVENAIWHGIVPAGNQGKIKVDFKREGGNLVCIVDDNGVGIKPMSEQHKNPNHLSIAMSNVKERLRIIAELNDSSWYLETKNKKDTGEGEGTIVIIKFPVVKT